MNTMAKPGKRAVQGALRSTSRASLTMTPHVAVGGAAKSEEGQDASAKMVEPMARTVDNDRRKSVGDDVAEHDTAIAHAERSRGLHELLLRQRAPASARCVRHPSTPCSLDGHQHDQFPHARRSEESCDGDRRMSPGMESKRSVNHIMLRSTIPPK